MEADKVLVIPCSGIGKSYGTVSREAAYIVTDELLAGRAEIIPLSMLVMDEKNLSQRVLSCPAVTIDGCKLACASKMVQECGGSPAAAFVVLDAFRRHREFKPQGITELNEGGQKLARVLAEEIAEAVRELRAPGGERA